MADNKVPPPPRPPLGAALGVAQAPALPLPPLDVKMIYDFVVHMRGLNQPLQLVLAPLPDAVRKTLSGGRFLLDDKTEGNVNTMIDGYGTQFYLTAVDVADRERRLKECKVLRHLEDNLVAMCTIVSDTRLVKEEQLGRETNGFVNSIIELAVDGSPAAVAAATTVQSLKDRQQVVQENQKREMEKAITTKVDDASTVLMKENLALKAETQRLRAQLDSVTRDALAASTTPPIIASDRRTDKR